MMEDVWVLEAVMVTDGKARVGREGVCIKYFSGPFRRRLLYVDTKGEAQQCQMARCST